MGIYAYTVSYQGCPLSRHPSSSLQTGEISLEHHYKEAPGYCQIPFADKSFYSFLPGSGSTCTRSRLFYCGSPGENTQRDHTPSGQSMILPDRERQNPARPPKNGNALWLRDTLQTP